MPKWLRRMVRMSFFGVGVPLIASGIVSYIEVNALFDVSVEQQLDMTAADMHRWSYALILAGALFVVLGALVPLPRTAAERAARVSRRPSKSS